MTSRTESTSLLAETLANLKQPPEVFMVASAVGFYGHSSEGVPENSDLVRAVLQRCVRLGKSLRGQHKNPVYVPSGCELESYFQELGVLLGRCCSHSR